MPARHPRSAVLVLAAAAALAPGTALAHSAVIGTDPADGATLTTAPAEATITFNEAVRGEFSYAKLTTADGAEVATTLSAEGPVVTAAFAEPLPNGRYSLAYRVASADTHPVSGKITFTVAVPGAASPTAVPSTSAAPSSTAASSTAPTSSAATTTSTTPATEAESDSGSSGPGWLLLTGLGLLAAVGGWFAGGVVRRRRG